MPEYGGPVGCDESHRSSQDGHQRYEAHRTRRIRRRQLLVAVSRERPRKDAI